MAINKKHKDRVFKFIFGKSGNRQWTLDLYNAVNGSKHENAEDIQFNTIEDAVFLGMKNDVSFIIMNEMNLWEHQSTYNPNMPMRFFIYAAKLYEKYVSGSEYYEYSSKLQSAPKPRCICFYNGTSEQPDKIELKLSDAFGGEGDIEVRVTMLNINYDKNKSLMGACRQLYEYAWLVAVIRKKQKIMENLEAAVEAAIEDMLKDFVIREFLLLNQAEVKGIFLTEYNQEKVLEQERREALQEGRQEGLQVGRQEGINEEKERVATDMLRDGKPIDEIKRCSRLAEEAIIKLAQTLGVTVM